jgi:hypothetical protein
MVASEDSPPANSKDDAAAIGSVSGQAANVEVLHQTNKLATATDSTLQLLKAVPDRCRFLVPVIAGQSVHLLSEGAGYPPIGSLQKMDELANSTAVTCGVIIADTRSGTAADLVIEAGTVKGFGRKVQVTRSDPEQAAGEFQSISHFFDVGKGAKVTSSIAFKTSNYQYPRKGLV